MCPPSSSLICPDVDQPVIHGVCSYNFLQVLHLVDFDQLKIENQQYLERIDAKNKELLQLKLSTGRTVQVIYECYLCGRSPAAAPALCSSNNKSCSLYNPRVN